MTRKKKPDQDLDAYLRGDSPLSRTYRAGAGESPPELLDARIRRQARDALAGGQSSRPWLNRWLPLAAAAVIVMSVSMVLFRVDRGDHPLPAASDAPASAPVPVEEEKRPVDVREADKPARLKTTDRAESLKKETAGPFVRQPASPPMAESVAPAPRKPEAESPKPPTNVSGAKQKKDHPALGTSSLAVPEEAAPAGRLRRAEVSSSMADQSRPQAALQASVIAVDVSGRPGAYQFSVTIRSPDQGCPQYANWWEVVSLDGRLLYRRVLLHSHTDEQPFTRSGGPVPIQPETVVWVRAHLHPQGYGGTAYRGSVGGGFRAATPPPGFAVNLSKSPPLPTGCAF